MKSNLKKYIQDGLKAGSRPEDIRKTLAGSGWDMKQVDAEIRGCQNNPKQLKAKFSVAAIISLLAFGGVAGAAYFVGKAVNKNVPLVAQVPVPATPEEVSVTTPEVKTTGGQKNCSLPPEKIENIPLESVRSYRSAPEFGDNATEIRYVMKSDITSVRMISSASEAKAQENLEHILSNFNYTRCSVVGKDGYCNSEPWDDFDFQWAAASLGVDVTVGGFNRFAYRKGKNYIIISRQIVTNSKPYVGGKLTKPLPPFPDLEMSVRPFIEALDCYVVHGIIEQPAPSPTPNEEILRNWTVDTKHRITEARKNLFKIANLHDEPIYNTSGKIEAIDITFDISSPQPRTAWVSASLNDGYIFEISPSSQNIQTGPEPQRIIFRNKVNPQDQVAQSYFTQGRIGGFIRVDYGENMTVAFRDETLNGWDWGGFQPQYSAVELNMLGWPIIQNELLKTREYKITDFK